MPTPGSGLSRRRFLARALTGGATIAIVGTGGLSYRVFDTAVLDPHHRDAYDPWTTWREASGPLGAVAAAILAANPHNTQPWTFRVTSKVIDVHADPARRVVALDPLGRETHIGLGCALENLVLGAQARGLDPTVSLLPDGSDDGWVASVALGPAPAAGGRGPRTCTTRSGTVTPTAVPMATRRSPHRRCVCSSTPRGCPASTSTGSPTARPWNP